MEEEILKEIRKNKIISIIEFIIIILLTIFQIIYIWPEDECNNYDIYAVRNTLQEIDNFNNQFISFKGAQNGINIKSLIARLIGNAEAYRNEPMKTPNVFIDKIKNDINENYQVNVEAIINIDEQDSYNKYIEKLQNIKNNIENRHEYYVEFTFQDNGYLDYVIISYDPDNVAETKYRKNIINN